MKLKIFLSALAAVTFSCALSVSADTYLDTIDYVVCDDMAVITGFEGSAETICIPGKIDGKTVCEIRENAFYKCDTLKKVIIPETVTKIGHHAFFECSALESVEINGEISVIGEGSFYDCTSLIEVILPERLKFIEDYSFYDCEKLESIELPGKLEEIGEYAFYGCESLSDVRLPDKLINIGNGAFYECKKIKSINVPDSVMSMGSCSIGFYGSDPKPIDDFSISGDNDSLGKIYAETNNLKFENVNEESEPKNSPILPAAIVIASSAGLMFFRFPEKVKVFRRRYEYEY